MPNQSNTYNIRRATKDDALDITFIGKKFVKESHNSHLGWNKDKVFSFVTEAVDREDFLILVLENDDDIVGVLAAFVTPCFFSDEWQAVELTWYVLPEHRKTRKAIEMLEAYENWAKEKGVAQINTMNLDMLKPEKVQKMYEKRGYRLVENTFAKELK